METMGFRAATEAEKSKVNLIRPGDAESMRVFFELEVRRAGWPIRAFHGEIWKVPSAYPIMSDVHTVGTMWFVTHIPTDPVWYGIAVNTIFYTAVLATFWFLIRVGYFYAFRHVIRVRRGLCPACAYPMGESVVCTECGTALPGRGAPT